MTATIWNPKDPNETVAYSDDWTNELGPDAISSYTLVIDSGDAVILKEENSPSTITAWIKDGTDQTTTLFTVTVTTGSGQVLIREYSLLISSGANSFQPTTTTKRDVIGQAYIEVALNNWEYDIGPDELNKALTRLDMLNAELVRRGIDINYNAPAAIGFGDLDDELGCPDGAFFGLAVLLAKRLCPSMGKALSKESREALDEAEKALRASAKVLVPTMQLARSTPLGSGNQNWPLYPFSQ